MVDQRNRFSYGAGIQYALKKLSFPGNTRATFASDAQIIQNAFIREISQFDPMFRDAFGGLSLAGSYLDDIKINLPEEFDMHIKICLDCDLEPISALDHPGFVFISASDGSSHCVRKFRNEGFFVNRLSIQNWFRDNISHVIPKLQKIRCEEGRVYSLDYTAHGYGVAHTLVATERRNPRRQISFDFVPVFEFDADEWPRDVAKRRNAGLNWFAVPCKYRGQPEEEQDPRSFILCAPHWERLVIKKKQNLKDSLRLMKALRNANEMPGLVSYFLKSVYLHNVDNKEVNWNQAPGRILIRVSAMLFLQWICHIYIAYISFFRCSLICCTVCD